MFDVVLVLYKKNSFAIDPLFIEMRPHVTHFYKYFIFGILEYNLIL